MRHPLLFLPFLALAGCAASIPPVEVTRFHLGSAPAPGRIAIEPGTGMAAESLEFGAYAAAVRREMTRLGYAEGSGAAYRLSVSYQRTTRDIAKSAPFSIGIGGGTSAGGVGVGLGTSFGLGNRRQTMVRTRLSVQMTRLGDSAMVWEGRAETESPSTAPAAQPGLAADKLARALFQVFPGESGRTITVP